MLLSRFNEAFAAVAMTILLWLSVVFVSLVLGEERVSYVGAKVLQVQGVSDMYEEILIRLKRKGVLEIWNVKANSTDFFVKRRNLKVVEDELKKAEINVRVLVDNLQEVIDTEKPSEGLSFRQGEVFSFDRFQRMADIHNYLDYLSHTYPQFVRLQDIGFSVEGRPLKMITILSGVNNSKSVWIDGGIHAREWISPASAVYIVSELVENRNAHAAYTSGIDYYILPLLNPDGYEYSHSVDRLWRKNRGVSHGCVGTDLNRNWDFHWGGLDTSRQYCSETYPGPRAFSEPETRAVSQFILSHAANMKGYVTLHSYGQYILYPWGYNRVFTSDYADLDRVGKSAAAAIKAVGGSVYTVGSSATTLYSASGGSDDWVKGVANVKYSFVIELRDTGYFGFLLPASYIRPTGVEALAAVKAISLAVQQTR